MPELPEVETIARALRQGGRGGDAIVGWRIQEGHLLWARTLAVPDSDTFNARIRGQVVTGIGRRGKFLVIELSQDWLLVHLRMTGDLRVEPVRSTQGEFLPLQPHDRLVLDFDNGMRLAFNDPRKFGRVWLVTNVNEVVSRLGPEPLEPNLTPDVFYEALQKRGKRQIKPLLLDQAFLAGLGNIYTDEALFAAGIHPLTRAGHISPARAEKLRQAIRMVIEEGIRRNGASFDWVYRGGKFEFQVYQRTGSPCTHCGTTILKCTVGQRGTHYCPTCQKE
jgi:formamidopyrimidine-DNA glycosylase